MYTSSIHENIVNIQWLFFGNISQLPWVISHYFTECIFPAIHIIPDNGQHQTADNGHHQKCEQEPLTLDPWVSTAKTIRNIQTGSAQITDPQKCCFKVLRFVSKIINHSKVILTIGQVLLLVVYMYYHLFKIWF